MNETDETNTVLLYHLVQGDIMDRDTFIEVIRRISGTYD